LFDEGLKVTSKQKPSFRDRAGKNVGYVVTSGSGGARRLEFADLFLDLGSQTLDLQVEAQKTIAYSCLIDPLCGGFLTTYVIKKGNRPLLVDKAPVIF
jgi:hypothetical protein